MLAWDKKNKLKILYYAPDVFFIKIFSTITKRVHKKEQAILKFLKNQNPDYKNTINKEKNSIKPFNKVIWTLWWQGEKNAPKTVQITLERMKKVAERNAYKFVVLDQENIRNYVNIPEFVYEKLERKIISLQFFSDIVRLSLLAEHGGIWFDSTLFLHEEIDLSVFETEFTTIKITNAGEESKNNISRCRWTGFCISSTPSSRYTVFLRDFILSYTEKNNFLVDYFLLDYAIYLLYEADKEFKHVIDNMPLAIDNDKLFFFNYHGKEVFDAEKWEQLVIPIVKTTYRYEYGEIVKGTYLERFISSELNEA
ncbi:capsular polysaccharide synthesis protein [Streptococcus suis]|uniref:Capsular polysaccharide synthesis protein n=1 Tax=Streptococcus suis TaxID=1307 RepID=M1VDT9_STRSU|nr:capsular polysaccharide synthesis protein [Streptococcus suis]APZ79112.1 Capsular polysaccharide synthesis protein [Streptococcus suis]MCK3935097.1 hypothetical protein [Streptococcus suis]MDG4527543.1 capsular polysaccharide synthesis protein [Streptococcus suis]MDG4529848.1 capsular polysaccharide synthesis protein [Streptococcus suis]NQK55351.1 hypothetical protein [Streptococcus suis]